jgi:hypothetical protein
MNRRTKSEPKDAVRKSERTTPFWQTARKSKLAKIRKSSRTLPNPLP